METDLKVGLGVSGGEVGDGERGGPEKRVRERGVQVDTPCRPHRQHRQEDFSPLGVLDPLDVRGHNVALVYYHDVQH
jgi:hypothetical protein